MKGAAAQWRIRTGSGTDGFIAWVNDCCKQAGSPPE